MLSVIMPAYNAEKYIEETLKSILIQKFKNYELLIYDDCSTDQTLNLIKKFKKKDPRIKIYRGKKNIGQPSALNFLITKTKYNLIALHDTDDVSLPDRFYKQVKFFLEKKNTVLLGSYCKVINEKSKILRSVKYPIQYNEIKKKLEIQNCFAQSSVIFKKEVIRKIGNFNIMFNPAQDYELWTRIAAIYKCENIPEYLMLYRQHKLSSSSKYFYKSLLATIFISAKYALTNKKKIKLNNIKNISFKIINKLFKIDRSKLLAILYYAKMTRYFKNSNYYLFIKYFIKLLFLDSKFLFNNIRKFLTKSFI